MKRLLTAAVGVPLVLLAVFRLPGPVFFWMVLGVIALALFEFTQIAQHWAPSSARWVVLLSTPALAFLVWRSLAAKPGPEVPLAVLALAVLGGIAATVALVSRTGVEASLPTAGTIALGTAYFALPVVALARVQASSPQWLVVLLAVVWLGDTAAYYLGKRFGRRKLAPVVSPNKTWEGAMAHGVAGLAAGAVGAWWVGAQSLGIPTVSVLILAALTSVAAQLGDLVESTWKRGAQVKDSGTLLPGHGGFLDRFDALLLAAPVWWVGLALLGAIEL